MGASFRKTAQILDLAGCDLLTISPDLLEKLASADGRGAAAAERRGGQGQRRAEASTLDEKTFRWMHNEDAMAIEKLADGIRKFYADAHKLAAQVAAAVV